MVSSGDLIPETILDSLVEDLERPHRATRRIKCVIATQGRVVRPILVSLTVGSSELE